MEKIVTLELICGDGGQNSFGSIARLPMGDLITAQNLTFEDDSWQCEGGSSTLNKTQIAALPGGSVPTINGLWDFWPTYGGSQIRIASTSDGRIISFGIDGIINTLVTGLTTNVPYRFTEGANGSGVKQLFMFNGHDPVLVTSDGVTTSLLESPPSDWSGNNQPICGVVHNDRLWCLGNSNYPFNLYYSALDDFENFNAINNSGVLNCYPGEGQILMSAFEFAGGLYLLKYPGGIYYLDDSLVDQAQWTVRKFTTSIGIAGPSTWACVDNDVYFLNTNGLIYSLQAVQAYGLAASVMTAAILPTKIVNYMKNNFSFNRMQYATAVYYSMKQEWHLAFTQTGYLINNRRLILDMHNTYTQPPPNGFNYRISTKDVCEAMALTIDSSGIQRPMVGDNNGYAWILDESARNVGGNAYTSIFETGEITLVPPPSTATGPQPSGGYQGTPQRVNLKFIEVAYKPMGSWNMSMDVFLDGMFSQTLQFPMGTTGGELGSFILGSSILGGANVAPSRQYVFGDCRRIRLKGYNTGVNQNFSITSIIIGFTPGSFSV